jgi:hypothetical protein
MAPPVGAVRVRRGDILDRAVVLGAEGAVQNVGFVDVVGGGCGSKRYAREELVLSVLFGSGARRLSIFSHIRYP